MASSANTKDDKTLLLIDSSGSVQRNSRYDETCAHILEEYSDAASIVLWASKDVKTTRSRFREDFLANSGGTAFSCALKHVDSKITTAVVLTDGWIQDVSECKLMGFNRNTKFIFYLWNQPDLSIPSACLGDTANIDIHLIEPYNPTVVVNSMHVQGDLAEAINYLKTTPVERMDFALVKGFAFAFRESPQLKRAISEMNTRLLKGDTKIYSVEEYENAPEYACDKELRDNMATIFNIMEYNSFSSKDMGDPYRPVKKEVTSFDSFVFEDAITYMDSSSNYLLITKPRGSSPILRDRADLLGDPLMVLLDEKMCKEVRNAVEYSICSGDTVRRLPDGVSPFTKRAITNILPLQRDDGAFSVAVEIFLGRSYSRCDVLWYLMILTILDGDYSMVIRDILKNCGVTLNLARNLANMTSLVTVEAYLVDSLRKLKKVPYMKVIELLEISGYDTAEFGDIHGRVLQKYIEDRRLTLEPESGVDLGSIDTSHGESCLCGKRKRERFPLLCCGTRLDRDVRRQLRNLSKAHGRTPVAPIQGEWKRLQAMHPNLKNLIRVLIFQKKRMRGQLSRRITREEYEEIRENIYKDPNYYDVNPESDTEDQKSPEL